MLRQMPHSLPNKAEKCAPSVLRLFRVSDHNIACDGAKKGIPMNHLIRLKRATSAVLITLSLLCLELLPKVQAVSPPPDGGYPGFNTAEGTNALKNVTTGVADTAVGWFSLFSNADGSFNTGVGAGTLLFNVGDQSTGEGVDNTAIGAAALLFNTTGSDNTAVGTGTLVNNDADTNTAVGAFALNSNTSGSANTANGFDALSSNTEGSANTASGVNALSDNTIGSLNTADGQNALSSNIDGANNTAVGQGALINNTSGDHNTAVGQGALLKNSTGSGNIAIGSGAGAFVGSSDNVIAIGSPGDNVDNTCFIGNIRDVQTQNADAIAVVIDSAGQLGTASSSRRFKTEIKPMNSASESILALKPVTFRYKNAKKGTPQFGLVAEEVAEVNPDLVVRDKNGEIYTVRYDAVNAMFLNEFLKEHRKVEEQEATIAQLKKEMETVVARLTEHESKIQKVSAQIEVGKAVGQTALNNP
jgi:Chaperone of endosialidase